MNLLKLSFLFVLITFLSACSDDDPTCIQSDWVGTYTGSQVCTGSDTSTEDNLTVTITASGSNAVIIKYEGDGFEIEYDPLTFDNCDIDKTDSGQGLTLTIDASIDGDKLTLIDIFSDGTDSTTCTLTATRN